MNKNFTEADMYGPIKEFLTGLGYQVKGEVKNCDVAAVKENEFILVELKCSFQLKLVYQAIERQKTNASVYVAIPRPEKGQNTKNWKSMLELLKRLEIGLLTVALDSEKKWVEVILTPGIGRKQKNKKKEQEIKSELNARTGDYNCGGITRKKIATAYREKCVELACILEGQGEMTLKEIYQYGLDRKISLILGRNYYKWFEKTGRGCYCLSANGNQMLKQGDFPEMILYYREKRKKIEENRKNGLTS